MAVLSSDSDDVIENIDDMLLEGEFKETSQTFAEKLIELPEIIEFINHLKTIITRQQKKILKLYSKRRKEVGYIIKSNLVLWAESRNNFPLQRARDDEKEEFKDAACQTDRTDEAKTEDDQGWDLDKIAEQAAEASTQGLTDTGYVYEPTSGMYYHVQTGYYYNAVSPLGKELFLWYELLTESDSA